MTAQLNFLVPLRARELGASFDIIGLIVGAGAVAPALLSVTSGALIDRLGPRRSFVASTAATAALSTLFLFVTSYWWLLLIQPLVGVTRNVGWLASQSYITSVGSEQQRHTFAGRFGFFSSTGQMAGPALIGGVAQLMGFRWAFVFLALYSATFTVIGLLLPDAAPPHPHAVRVKQGGGFRSAWEILFLRPIQVVLLLSCARLWITWIYTAFLPIYLVDNGLQLGVIGLVMATSGLVASASAPTVGFWTRFLRPPTVAILGVGCGAMGLVLAPHVAAVPMIYLVPALVGIGNGVSLPVLLTIVASAAPAGKRGVALGLRAAANQTAAAAGPIIVGALISGLGILVGFTVGGLVAAGILAGAQLLQPASPTADVEPS